MQTLEILKTDKSRRQVRIQYVDEYSNYRIEKLAEDWNTFCWAIDSIETKEKAYSFANEWLED